MERRTKQVTPGGGGAPATLRPNLPLALSEQGGPLSWFRWAVGHPWVLLSGQTAEERTYYYYHHYFYYCTNGCRTFKKYTSS